MSNVQIELPLGLRSALENGECALFLGAGVGKHLFDADGNPAPDGARLAEEMAAYFGIDTSGSPGLAKISQVVELRHKGRKELEAYVRSRLSDLHPDETFRWFCNLRWKAIFTTNYDSGILKSYELTATPPQTPVPIASTSGLAEYDPRFQVPVYYLHGHLDSPDSPHLVITENDYIRFRERRRMLFEHLKSQLAVSNILYIGYSNQDPNWSLILDEISAEFSPSPIPLGYRVSPSDRPVDLEILTAKGIHTIPCDLSTFVASTTSLITTQRISSDRLNQLRKDVPSEFVSMFEENPAPVVRLLETWTFVNHASFALASNTRQFLRGERANWSLIAARRQFERDIEQEVYDELLDFATASSLRPKASIILGSAGYGTTTLLMSLAVRLVHDKAGHIFMLKPGRSLREGDIEFACSVLKSRPVFVVDDASRQVSQLHQALGRLRDLKYPAMFLLGSRLNEWMQLAQPPRADPHRLEPLSDPEIQRLLDCLEAQGELNVLAPLSPAHRFASIKKKHQKQLLVAMREATEGREFDAILEDEYRRLPEGFARSAYLITSCFHQFGVPLRAELLANLLGTDLSSLYRELSLATEGVIVFEELDRALGLYAAQTRHRIIASVVWSRCANQGDRVGIVQQALSGLNLSYRSDREAFDSFYQSDTLVDDLGSLDNRTRFFENAIDKDPDNPYVLQHYARMLLRSGSSSVALTMINRALELSPETRILHHTKGTILADLSHNADSDEVGRKFLTRAEASFQQTIKLNPKDAYGYHGLAQLYVGWAKRVTGDSESTDYIAKAEEVIREGLGTARTRDSLYIVSSDIERLVGEVPRHLAALERAVGENPGGVIARYLLGRAYLDQNRMVDAMEVLEPVIQNNFEEPRAFVLYASAMVRAGKSYEEATAVMNLATPWGFRDPRFIATLGGMYFMDGRFSKADEVFQRRLERPFSADELESTSFRPRRLDEPDKYLELQGVVRKVKPGYSFIEASGYPHFFCPASKYEGLVIRERMDVTFQPAFSTKGPVALHPRLLGTVNATS